eukprot:Seg1019.4 transcript_id=Seg1019.4/GoldUCD/mRNA.D3Y31 product=Mitofusin-2 protein_id=Seg1019.4/GoldUCD/D3Y31
MPQLNKMYRKTNSVSSTSPLIGLQDPMAISPLQRFVRAKKLINQTFDELTKYLKEVRDFLMDCEVSDELDHETRKDLEQVSSYLDQVSGITAVLSRDHMKVAFFGRTSNGKSTVVNAMLTDKILPSGIGHTTNCFVSVMGCTGNEGYMNTPDSKEKRSVESLQQLAHALGDDKIDSSSLIQVFWPKDQCALLRDDVVFVDSPGIDVTPDLDSWIDKHCLDADVFVLVVNSESTLNQTEKSFFHKVNTRLSKPNVFILNNRWDASSDGDPAMMAKVKQQHLERTTNFLVEELRCVSKREATDRVFFVSALETLRHRMKQNRIHGQQTASHLQRSESIETDLNGNGGEHRARLIEFENFEIKFQECISKSAITTKFESHASRGKGITTKLRSTMEQVVGRAYSQRRRCEAQKLDLEERLDYMTTQFETLMKEIKNKIQKFSEEVEQQVAKAMSDEIKRLGYLVGDFDYPFHPHHGFLKTYKAELYSHIEKGLGKNLKARCSALLLDSIEEYKTEMRDEIHSLIPPGADSCNVQLTPRRDFEVSYELDVHSLCTDFQEDISFHFSLGWTNLVKKFLAPRNARLAILLGANISKTKPIAAIATAAKQAREQLQSETEEEKAIATRRKDEMLEYPGRYDENELTVAVVHALASVTSTTSCAILVVAGLVWRTLGWKLIIGITGGYGTLYVFERARWTNSARENTFKKQFVSYASEKLQLVVSFTSKSCSHQVEQELSSAFIQLESEIDHSKKKLKAEIEELGKEMKRLEEIEAKSKVFRNKASWLESELNGFIKEFGLSKSRI